MKKIVVIDDTPHNLKFIKTVVEKRIPNCEVLMAESGKIGLKLVEKEMPDTVLLDVNMPEMNGFDVCRVLKQNESTSGIPVLMVSALGNDTKIRIDGLKSGADAFISRPFDNGEFIALINTLLRNKESDDLLKRQNKDLEGLIKKQLLEFSQHEKRLMQISDFVLEFFWEVDHNLKFTYVSPTVKNILGYDISDLQFTYQLHDFIIVEKQKRELHQILSTIERRDIFNRLKVLCETREGDQIWLVMSGFPIFNEENQYLGYRGMFQNITQRIKDEEKHSMVINTSLDGFLMTNAENQIIEVNEAFCNLTGFSEAELLGKKFMEDEISFMEDEISAEERQTVFKDRKSTTSNKHIRFETILLDKKMKQLDVELSINYAVIDKQQKFIFVRDISDRKRTEEKEAKNLERLNAYQKRLKILHSKLIEAEEKERKNMAALLHDGIGQSLAIAHLKLSSITKYLLAEKPHKIITETLHLIDRAIHESRMLTYDLSPPMLHELGLISTLKWKLDQIHKEFGLHTSLREQKRITHKTSDTHILLYRIVTELFNNIIKHAEATEIEVIINRNQTALQLEVNDNGKGFNPDEISSRPDGGFGLFSIRERLESIQGTIEIESAPQKGTSIKLHIPD